ncbi:redox-regulated ATPase YchF [Blattabacterium cuenoti]|uniref:redox-regulated ATPase YchF n=1 Tax=Blattabacterium cuenoti TaxID=1653831 RepID=UPI00163BFD6D|nr:redox-regulated ATPase YchF [Blattabacterium cuenoti]
MKCGIIGLPNVGKSTFFNIISNSKVLSKNFPFCTINPNHGVIKVADDRLLELNKFIKSNKIIPSEIKIVDIAGLIKGSHKGDGLGNKFLSHIRETDAIIHMIRFFNDMNILHVEGDINPIRDKEIIDMELQLKDLSTIEKKIDKISNDLSSKKKNNEFIFLKKILIFLKKGKNIRMYPFKNDERKYIKNLQLLTEKPVLYICNTNDDLNIIQNKPTVKLLQNIVKMENSNILFFSLKKRINFNYLFKNILFLLNLKTFFTVGKKEIRAWNIPKSYTTYEASSIIHTDFKKGFIKAEIIRYDHFIKYQSEEKLKKLGKIFLAGKNYLIKDGDIIYFRFSSHKKNL